MLRAGAIGRSRKAVAGLLVLAMLALSAAPAMAMAPLRSLTTMPPTTAACPATTRTPPPFPPRPTTGNRMRGRHDAPPGLACCIALQCPMLLGGLPAAAAQPSPSPGPSVRSAFRVRRHAGIDIAPALPPPREAA